jgi:ketosteroid isomerase-like protein
MRDYDERERRNIATVTAIFEAGPEFDRLAAFADDAVWWNGLPRIAGAPGTTEHRGKDAIGRILGGAGTDRRAAGVDAYDLTTTRYEDVVTLADGDWVVRQHTMHARTHGGRDYANVYCFVFRFAEDGRVAYLTEHWNTWHAERFLLDQWRTEPAHPLAGVKPAAGGK